MFVSCLLHRNGRALCAWGVAFVLASILNPAFAQKEPPSNSQDSQPGYGITSIAFSHDSQVVAIVKGNLQRERYNYYNRYNRGSGYVNYKSEVEIWNLADKKLLQKLSDFGGPVLAASFSPDGKRLATASWEIKAQEPSTRRASFYRSTGVLKVFDIETGEMIWSQKSANYDLVSLFFSPDGTKLFSAGNVETWSLNYFLTGEVKIWDARSGEMVRAITSRAPVISVALSPDSKIIAVKKKVFSESRSEVKLYDAGSLTELKTLELARDVKSEGNKNIAFSPDSGKLAISISGLRNNDLINEIRIIDVQTGKTDRVFAITKETLELPKGSWWDKERVKFMEIARNNQAIISLVYLNNQRIAVINCSIAMQMWDVQTGEVKWAGRSNNPASTVTFSHDGDTVAIGYPDNTTAIWEPMTGTLKQKIVSSTETRNSLDVGNLMVSVASVLSVAYSPDGKQLASASNQGVFKVWDVRAALEKQTKPANRETAFTSVAFSPDGKTLATASRNGKVILWEAEEYKPQRELADNDAAIHCVAFSVDGRLVAGASQDGAVRVWETETGKLKHKLAGHSDAVLYLAFSPDETTLATASADRTVRLWNMRTGESRFTMNHAASLNAIAFSLDGRTLASASAEKTIQLWDTGTGQLKATLSGHDESINAVAFSPDGKTLASGSEDKTVRLWNTQTWKVVRTLKGHDVAVYALAFSPDGGTLAAATGNNAIAFWNWQTGELKRVLKDAAKLQLRNP